MQVVSYFLSLTCLLCVACVLLVVLILLPFIFTNPVFPTLPRKIPCVFPVKVTYKTSTKKSAKAKTKKLTYTLKVAKVGVALSGDSVVAIGSTTKLTNTKKNSSRAKITYTSSDDSIATVAADGTVTGVKAGKATIKAKITVGKDSAETTKDVEVKKYVLKSVAQTKADTFETSITGATKEIKASEITVKNTENNVVVPVKSVSVDSKDATKVTFTTFAGLTDGKTYDVTLDGTTKQVPVSNGKVASVNVNTLTVPVATETEIKLVSKDANGVVLDEYAYDPSSSSYSSKYDFSLTTNNGYVNGSKLYLNKIGDTATAEVTYKSGKYGTDGKPEGNVTSGKVTITAVDQAAVNNFGVKVADANAQSKKFDKIDANTQVAVGETNMYAYFQIKDANNNEVSNYYNYSVESSDKNVLMLGGSTLDAVSNSNHRVLVTPVKAGTAYILIKDKDNKIVGSVAITVVAERTVATMDVDKTSATLSNAMTKTATVTASFKDQYAKNIDVTKNVKVTCLSTTADKLNAEKVNNGKDANDSSVSYFNTPVYSGNKVTVTFNAQGITAGTYQYKISYEKDNKEVCARVITIVIQAPATNGTISFGIDVDKNEVDNLVDKDHKDDQKITIAVNELRNGVPSAKLNKNSVVSDTDRDEKVQKIDYKIEDKDGKTVYNSASSDSKLNTVSGCAFDFDVDGALTVTTVSCSAVTANVPAEKYFAPGTYKVTATVKTGKDADAESKWVTKTFMTTFTVKDSQPVGTLTIEKDSVKDVAGISTVEDAIKNAVKFVYADKTYSADANDKTLVIVSVEGITNDGKKITKDNFTDADIIANATDITINKVTFTVGDDSTSVNVEASPSNSNTIVLK